MITCPECGFAASDDAKFCDRCGQGLAQSPTKPAHLPPLAPGTILRDGLEVVQLLAAGAVENRYRATRRGEANNESFQLRERIGPVRYDAAAEDRHAPSSDSIVVGREDDPNGPRARTRELKAPTAESTASPPFGDPVPQAAGAAADSAEEQETPQSAPASTRDASSDIVSDAPAQAQATSVSAASTNDASASSPPTVADDLGEDFGRVLGLSLTLNHPAFYRALSGFAHDGRVYLVYPDETLSPLSRRPGGIRMREPEAIGLAIQLCQAVSALHRRGLRVNDICPDSAVFAADGRVKLTGLDYVSNDTELQSEPMFNDGYTAPEIYKGRKVDKRADVFSIGALLYACLSGSRIAAESWREEAGAVSFYPPHVVSPKLEQAVRRALAFNPEDRWPTVDALKAELIRLNGTVRVRAAALTDVGMVRELNEDSVMAVEYARQSLIEPDQNYLYLVADGMGGAEAGEVASAIAVATVRDYVENRLAGDQAKDLSGLLTNALEEANRKILERQAENPELRGMGSTAVSALIVPPQAAIAWVGDSRAYLSEGSAIRQVTRDHSLVQRLIEIGQLTADQARHHEHKNVITRSLGARQNGPAGAEAVAMRLKRGDRMLLCSDGLTAHVEDQRIGEIVQRHDDPSDAAGELVAAANAGGGTDNVSVVVIFLE